MQRSLTELEQKAHDNTGGKKFSLTNNTDVSEILFDVLKLPVPPNAKSYAKKGGKQYGVGAEVCVASPAYVVC